MALHNLLLVGKNPSRGQDHGAHISPFTMPKQYSYFCAGPAKLPDEVLSGLQAGLLQYRGTHVSMLELSHRSNDFKDMLVATENNVRNLLKVPSNYRVLLMAGGGNGQFAAVPLNLISRTGKADYIVTGSWSDKAAKEATKYGTIHRCEVDKTAEGWRTCTDPEASYVYYCENETVDGVEFQTVPEVPAGVPLVCDMSSNIFTRPFDISKFGLIYGGAQKNCGTAGVTLVIIREDLLGNPLPTCPSILDYTITNKHQSIFNTPPVFPMYVMSEVLQWVAKEGGVEEMSKRTTEKSNLLYSIIDHSSGFYATTVHPTKRSRMNVVFRVGSKEGNEELEKKFVEEATQQGLLSLKGHRSVGGIRASLYNAITMEEAERLGEFMKAFQRDNKA